MHEGGRKGDALIKQKRGLQQRICISNMSKGFVYMHIVPVTNTEQISATQVPERVKARLTQRLEILTSGLPFFSLIYIKHKTTRQKFPESYY